MELNSANPTPFPYAKVYNAFLNAMLEAGELPETVEQGVFIAQADDDNNPPGIQYVPEVNLLFMLGDMGKLALVRAIGEIQSQIKPDMCVVHIAEAWMRETALKDGQTAQDAARELPNASEDPNAKSVLVFRFFRQGETIQGTALISDDRKSVTADKLYRATLVDGIANMELLEGQ